MEQTELINGLISADLQSAEHYTKQAMAASSAPIFLETTEIAVRNYRSVLSILDQQEEFKLLFYQDFQSRLNVMWRNLKSLLIRLKKFECSERNLQLVNNFTSVSNSISSLLLKQVKVNKSTNNLASRLKFYPGNSMTTPRLIAEAYLQICDKYNAQPLDSETFSRMVQNQIGIPSEAGIYRIGGFLVKLFDRMEIPADPKILFGPELGIEIDNTEIQPCRITERPEIDKKYAEIAARMRNKKPIRMIAEG